MKTHKSIKIKLKYWSLIAGRKWIRKSAYSEQILLKLSILKNRLKYRYHFKWLQVLS